MKKLPLQDCVTDEHARGIGLVIAQWASAERLLTHAICDLMANRTVSYTDDAADLIVMSGREARVLIGLVKSLVRFRFPDDADAFDKIADKLGKEGKTRNIIAHGLWSEGKRPNSIVTYHPITLNNPRVERHEFTPQEFERMAHRILEKGKKIISFLRERGLLRWETLP